jgi:hypothetical protein
MAPVRQLTRDIRLAAQAIDRHAKNARVDDTDDLVENTWPHIGMRRKVSELRSMLDVLTARIGKADR